jgi:hypothetical protein
MAIAQDTNGKQGKRLFTKLKSALARCNPFRRKAVLASALLLASCGAPENKSVQEVNCRTDCADVRIDSEGDSKELFSSFLKKERCKSGCNLFDIPELSSISMDLPVRYRLVGEKKSAVLYMEQIGDSPSLDVWLSCDQGQVNQSQCRATLDKGRALSIAVGEAVIDEKIMEFCQLMETPVRAGSVEMRVDLHLFGINKGKGNISNLVCIEPK